MNDPILVINEQNVTAKIHAQKNTNIDTNPRFRKCHVFVFV